MSLELNLLLFLHAVPDAVDLFYVQQSLGVYMGVRARM